MKTSTRLFWIAVTFATVGAFFSIIGFTVFDGMTGNPSARFSTEHLMDAGKVWLVIFFAISILGSTRNG